MAIRTDHPIYGRVKRKVVLGQLPAGDAINVRALQEEMSTSQVPIREALIGLAAEDLVDFVHGRGFFSKSHSLAEILGDIDLIQFFLVDAARYISESDAVTASLETALNTSALNDDGLDPFEHALAVSKIFVSCYRQPHSELVARSLYRRCYILNVDSALSGVALVDITRAYFRRIVEDDLANVRFDIEKFCCELKSRLPETLLMAERMGPLGFNLNSMPSSASN